MKAVLCGYPVITYAFREGGDGDETDCCLHRDGPAVGGFIEYAGKRYPYEPVAFDLAKGETKEIAFHGRGLQTIATRYNVRLTGDGNTIYFDDSFRQRIVLVNQNWERGQSYHPAGSENDVGVAISGMTFFVKLKDLPGAPQRIIIERR